MLNPAQSSAVRNPSPSFAPDVTQEFLSFRLGAEEYGIDILKVQEIRNYAAVTTIANAPPFIKGVINLRGAIVPIVDLRLKFNVGEVRYDAFTVVIVLNVAGRVIGAVVDSVSDVLILNAGEIRPVPEFAAAVNTRFISGLATVSGGMLILLDIEALLTSPEMELSAGHAH
jgi:purine-binding chemotaxis protein CheW